MGTYVQEGQHGSSQLNRFKNGLWVKGPPGILSFAQGKNPSFLGLSMLVLVLFMHWLYPTTYNAISSARVNMCFIFLTITIFMLINFTATNCIVAIRIIKSALTNKGRRVHFKISVTHRKSPPVVCSELDV